MNGGKTERERERGDPGEKITNKGASKQKGTDFDIVSICLITIS